MKLDPNFRRKLKKLLEAQNGVLTKMDLWNIVQATSEVEFYRQVEKLSNEQLLFKFMRGIYVGPKFSIPNLVMTIKPDAYLSLEYVLAQHNMIGTYSERKIRPISPVSSRTIKSGQTIIEFKKISTHLWQGVHIVNGIRTANKEQAYLDTLYLYQKGTKFYFDIHSDIDTSPLNNNLLYQYLEKYKNTKFRNFVKGILND